MALSCCSDQRMSNESSNDQRLFGGYPKNDTLFSSNEQFREWAHSPHRERKSWVKKWLVRIQSWTTQRRGG
jgi:hypothetical protein